MKKLSLLTLIAAVSVRLSADGSIPMPLISENATSELARAINVGKHDRTQASAMLKAIVMPKMLRVGFRTPSSEKLSLAVQRAIQTWQDSLPELNLVFADRDGLVDVSVQEVDTIGEDGEAQGLIRYTREYLWGRRSSDYNIDATIQVLRWVGSRQIRDDETQSVITHEIGHLLGLDDSPGSGSLMGFFVPGRPVLRPSAGEVDALRKYRGYAQTILARYSHT